MNKSIFTESKKIRKDGEDYILTAKIVPFGKISRNNVMYDKDSVIRTHKKLIGKPVLFNHKKDAGLPGGEWIDSEIRSDGMYGTAKIYNVNYNEDLIDYLSRASNPTVSLEVVGEATKKVDEETGRQYALARVNDWLEASIVNVPGFEEARVLNFEYYIAESLGLGIQNINDGGISVDNIKEIFDRLDKHEVLMEKMVSYLEKLSFSENVESNQETEIAETETKVEETQEQEPQEQDGQEQESQVEEVKSEEVPETKVEEEVTPEVTQEESQDSEENSEEESQENSEENLEENSEEESQEDSQEIVTEGEASETETNSESLQKEEIRTSDERDNKEDKHKNTDQKDKDEQQKPKIIKDEDEEPKEPETKKESIQITQDENKTNSYSEENIVWNEMLKRHFEKE